MRDAYVDIDTRKSIEPGSGVSNRGKRTNRADGVLEDFQKERFHIRQTGAVVYGREAPGSDYRIEFFLSTFLHGVLDYGEDERHERCRRLGWGWH